MARNVNNLEKRGNSYFVLPRNINADWSSNGSREFEPSEEEIQNMVKSLREEGQLQPVVIGLDKAEPYLKMGFCRHKAMTRINEENVKAGMPEIPLECVIADGNEEDSFRRNIIENLHRNELSAIDIAHQIRKWQDIYKKPDAFILELYGTPNKPRSISWLAQHRTLLNLEYELQKRVHYGEFTFTEAVKLASYDKETRTKVLAQYEAEKAKIEESAAVETVTAPATTTATAATVSSGSVTEVEGTTTEAPATAPATVAAPAEAKGRAASKKPSITAAAQAIGVKVARTQKQVREGLEALSTGSAIANAVLDFMKGTIDQEQLEAVFDKYERTEEEVSTVKVIDYEAAAS